MLCLDIQCYNMVLSAVMKICIIICIGRHKSIKLSILVIYLDEWIVFMVQGTTLLKGYSKQHFDIKICNTEKSRGHLCYSGSALDCWSTGRAIDPAPGA